MKKFFAAGLLVVFLHVPVVYAQSGPEKGGHEMGIWTSGGLGFSQPTSGTGIWNIGARYGWILTEQHGPGSLRGRFEYAADVVPVFWVFQPSGTAYGFSLNPIVLKWNLKTRRFIAPYFELFGGTVFTNHPVPDGTSRLNFTGGELRRSKSTTSRHTAVPSPFLSRKFPVCSIIRPTETKGAAMGAVKALTDDGLFIGQSPQFFELLQDLASDADAAGRDSGNNDN